MHIAFQTVPPGKQCTASAAAEIGPFIRRGKGKALSVQQFFQFIVGHIMIEKCLPPAVCAMKPGAAYQIKPPHSGALMLLKRLQPVRMFQQPGILETHRLPSDLFQFPPCQHRRNRNLPDRSHILPNEFLRSPLIFIFFKYIVQFFQILFVQSRFKALPTDGDGISGDKYKLPAAFFKDAGGAAAVPTAEPLQPLELQPVAICHLLHKSRFIPFGEFFKIRAE